MEQRPGNKWYNKCPFCYHNFREFATAVIVILHKQGMRNRGKNHSIPSICIHFLYFVNQALNRYVLAHLFGVRHLSNREIKFFKSRKENFLQTSCDPFPLKPFDRYKSTLLRRYFDNKNTLN